MIPTLDAVKHFHYEQGRANLVGYMRCSLEWEAQNPGAAKPRTPCIELDDDDDDRQSTFTYITDASGVTAATGATGFTAPTKAPQKRSAVTPGSAGFAPGAPGPSGASDPHLDPNCKRHKDTVLSAANHEPPRLSPRVDPVSYTHLTLPTICSV